MTKCVKIPNESLEMVDPKHKDEEDSERQDQQMLE